MILFIFEGEKREIKLFQYMQQAMFPTKNDYIKCSFGNNIYELYRQLQKDENIDIVGLIRQRLETVGDTTLEGYTTSDFAEIYLFFDYDFHNTIYPPHELNSQIEYMLRMFDCETEQGKLYINYPMIESISYTKMLPDSDYWRYTVERAVCSKFKFLSSQFSAYKNYKFLTDKENWLHLEKQNVKKANAICSGKNELPEHTDDISQMKIFERQKQLHIIPYDRVAILNALPLFLYEYGGGNIE